MNMFKYKLLNIFQNISFTSILFCAGTNLLIAQDCIQDLKNAYGKEQGFIKRICDNGNVWNMKYTMTAEVLNPNTKHYEIVTTNGELSGSKNIRYIKTPNIEVVMDPKDIFTITHANKTIMHTRTKQGALSTINDMYTQIMEDSILKMYQASSCIKTTIKDCDSPVTEYILTARDKKKCQYLKLSVFIEVNSNIPRKVFAEVNPLFTRSAKSYTLVIQQRDQLKMDGKWQHARDLVFNQKGSVKAPYTNYKYKDLAEKKIKKV